MGRVRGLGHRRRSRFSGCGCGYDWTSAGIDVLVDTPIHRRDGNAVARFSGLGDQGFDLTQAHGLTAELRDANQGASSITQQLARNAYDLKNRAKARNEGSFGRKFVEIALARRITGRYSKGQVLEFYLNRVYFGSGFYGIRAASLGYFGKGPADLATRGAASTAALHT